MRPEVCDCSQASCTRLQTPTLIGCILLKNGVFNALLTCVQRRMELSNVFSIPVKLLACLALIWQHLQAADEAPAMPQAINFFSLPTFPGGLARLAEAQA